ncbi:MAG: hypothetical protein LQ341_006950, partial [Variospora aurantia]
KGDAIEQECKIHLTPLEGAGSDEIQKKPVRIRFKHHLLFHKLGTAYLHRSHVQNAGTATKITEQLQPPG